MWGDGFVTAHGRRLEYRCWGPDPSGGAAIVLLHEGLGSVALWRGFPQALVETTGLPVLAYSRAGYGFSDADDLPRPLDWMTHEAVEVLPQVLSAFALDRPILVGHSDGATIAAIHAGLVGGLRGVTLMAPHFFTEEMGLAEIARAARRFDTSDLPERMARYHTDPRATFRGWADAWLSPGFRDWNVAEVLDDTTCPILAIQGVQDEYGTKAQIDVISTRARDVRVHMLDPCGHSPHLERQDAVLSAISDWLFA
ncbi:alpha/beta fold hydrolase [Hasllibacter sp. MH4015]|uniref:alpha/beta fold hydrolase n=1 Tax=Hasllibacter sp. MH4015 TaxID=2854029 RepID=UPI001CD3D28B|nr:alpha/beta hydrolase [Hasllibacter sp. MH4015]